MLMQGTLEELNAQVIDPEERSNTCFVMLRDKLDPSYLIHNKFCEECGASLNPEGRRVEAYIHWILGLAIPYEGVCQSCD